MTEVNYHLADVSEASAQGERHTPPTSDEAPTPPRRRSDFARFLARQKRTSEKIISARERGAGWRNNGCAPLRKEADFCCSNGRRRVIFTKRLCCLAGMSELM